MTRQSLIDSAVRQAYREDPRAAHILLTDYAEFPELTEAMAKRKVPLIPWAHFITRVRNLYEGMVTRETFNPHRQTPNPEIQRSRDTAVSELVEVAPRYIEGLGAPYAEAGEKTYCENGHFLGRFVRDVKVGDMRQDSDFSLAPGCSLLMTECPECGGAVIASWGVYFFEVAPFNPEIQR